MTQPIRLINGGIALLLISVAGCAGSGLKGMFTRNETAGYQTLEEIEAEKNGSGGSETPGPRFASWVPFTKKSGDTSEAVASTGSEGSPTSDPTTKSGWLKNPFRRQETVEPDPFLSHPDASESTASKKEKKTDPLASRGDTTKDRNQEELSSLKEEKPVKEEKPIRTVSAYLESDSEDDGAIAEKFEKHFQKSGETVADAEESEDPATLLTAGNTKPKAGAVEKKTISPPASDARADDKLMEFEKLLAARNSAAKKKSPEPQFADEPSSVDVAAIEEPQGGEEDSSAAAAEEHAESEDFDNVFAQSGEAGKTKPKQNRSTSSNAEQAIESFDSLLGEEPVVAKKASDSRTRGKSRESEAFESPAVEIEDAGNVFGAKAATKPHQETMGLSRNAAKASGNVWSQASSDSFTWSSASKGRSSTQATEAEKSPEAESTASQFAAMFADARAAESVPPAVLPDTPEFGMRVPVPRASEAWAFGTSRPAARTIRNVSAERNIPVTAADANPQRNPLTASSSTADHNAESVSFSTAAAASVNDANVKRTAGSRFRARNWIMLFCGIIVVALLFAPGRKKPMQVNQMPL